MSLARFDPTTDREASKWLMELRVKLENQTDLLRRAKDRPQTDQDAIGDRIHLLRKLIWQGWGVNA